MDNSHLLSGVERCVGMALAEDIGIGDVTAALVNEDQFSTGRVYARQSAIICGAPWFNEVFRQIDSGITLNWIISEGARVEKDQPLVEISGRSRGVLTAERSALNFLQTLSATATVTAQFVDAVRGSGVSIVDTRKTLPGLRNAQKYAVQQGGGKNHRIGLYDGILIKENHIAAAGGIANAIAQARALKAGVPLMTEAETLDEACIAIEADVDLLLVDEFTPQMLAQAVQWIRAHRQGGGKTLIEYSGSASLENIAALAESGVDRISIGSLTKHVQAVDLSMRFD